MSLCEQYPLCIQQGSAFAFTVTYLNAEKTAPEVDLSSYAAILQARRQSGGDLLLEVTSEDDEITFDANDGIIFITLPKSKVNALPTNNRVVEGWVYGLQIYDPADKDNTARLLLHGELTVHPSPVQVD